MTSVLPRSLRNTSAAATGRSKSAPRKLLDITNLLPYQQEIVDAFRSREYSLIASDGSVRAGKTVAFVCGMMGQQERDRIDGVGNRQYILGGPTIGSIIRNQIAYWRDIAYQLDWQFRWTGGIDGHKFHLNDAEFALFAGDDVRDVQRVQGYSATGAYLDEAIHLTPQFVEMVVTRGADDEYFVALSTNASSPYNHIKTDYIDAATYDPDAPYENERQREAAKRKAERTFHRTAYLGDNRFIGDQRRQELEEGALGGTGHDRLINVLWVPDEGLVVPVRPEHVTRDVFDLRGFVSVDVGITGTAACLLFVKVKSNPDVWCIADELLVKGSSERPILDEELADRCFAKWGVSHFVVDPAQAALFKARVRARGYRVLNARNDILQGIHAVNNGLARGRLLIHDRCRQLLRAWSAYEWDPKTEKPKKNPNDHAPDSARYGTMHVLPPTTSRITPADRVSTR